MPSILLVARQYYYSDCPRKDDGFIDEDSCYVPFWNTKTGVIVKWSLFLAILVFCGLYLLIGSIHAKKRVQKGLPPLGYHRFLVPRTTLARVDPRYRWPQASIRPYGGGVGPGGQQAYGMYSMPPPPVYDPNAPRPPMYEPPADSTKFDYSQQPPPGQPPSSQPGAAASGPVNFGQHVEYAPPVGPPPPPAAAAAAAQQPPQDMYAPPPGPPPSAARSAGETIQPQGTGSANPFRS